jgi:leucyl-tRNA synthetase
MLSDSPPERDLEWTEAGVDGAFRFLQRLWRDVTEPDVPFAAKDAAKPENLALAADAAWRAVHKTIASVSDNLENFRFNVAVAQIRTPDPSLLVDESVTLAVQVNGKLRGTIAIARDAAEQVAKDAALAVANVQTAMAGKPARKIVVVPNKIVNIVV